MVLGVLALFLVALVSSALAAPTHLHKPALDITGLNHACGTAVDSKGDVYVSSAGESKIKVFNPAHAELTSIANSNEPCGLAVDSNGNLYVSEQGTGKVVRYVPNAYPFSGAPTYGAAETIDGSGNAMGIAVDPFDDRLYVARGDHVAVYRADGAFDAVNEVQRVFIDASAGTYTLTFDPDGGGPQPAQTTAPIAEDASAPQVQAALEALPALTGNVSVDAPDSARRNVTFVGAFAATDVEQLVADGGDLSNPPFWAEAFVSTTTQSFDGLVADGGDLTDATGVAAYTYKGTNETSDRYLFAADAATGQVKILSGPDIRKLKLRKTINGPKPGEDFGFGAVGAYLTVDPGNGDPETQKCVSIAEQACTAGHLFVYDDNRHAVDEFEATGEFLGSFTDPGLADAQPTALAIDRSGGATDGIVYVSSGAGAGSKLLAFAPLVAPSRTLLAEPLTHVLKGAVAVATDSVGNVYAAAGPTIHVYDPNGAHLAEFEDGAKAKDLAVDSTGKIYVIDGPQHNEQVTYYTPAVYPPVAGTTYARHTPPIFSISTSIGELATIGIDPTNDHIFVGGFVPYRTVELGSAKDGSPVLDLEWGPGGNFAAASIDFSADGEAYVVRNSTPTIDIMNAAGTEIVTRITGSGSPAGPPVPFNSSIAVDQSNGHVLVMALGDNVIEEYDASGTFVAQFGEFSMSPTIPSIAVDNSCAVHDPPLTETTSPTCQEFNPANGTVYVAYDQTQAGTPDIWAFSSLSYGEPPIALTGLASGLGAGSATLNGTVDPRGFPLTDCHFDYQIAGSAGAPLIAEPCAETLAQIGNGVGPVPVHADLTGLAPDVRYEFRLAAANEFGTDEGDPGLFGPPLLTAKPAQPIHYTEATVRATIDPSGLPTTYRVEYTDDDDFQANAWANAQVAPVPDGQLAAGAGPTDLDIPLFGLAEGTTYDFRLIVENAAKTVNGPDQTLTTLARPPVQSCPNDQYRTGLSAKLPDCRAYELVTPPETGGANIFATSNPLGGFNQWLTPPRGTEAGNRVTFSSSRLFGFEGNGRNDSFRVSRGAGSHPLAGWTTEIFSPSFVQAAGDATPSEGVSADQNYQFFSVEPQEPIEGAFPAGHYLRTPAGFESLGVGSLGDDPEARPQFATAGGTHVVFSSKAGLEPEAAPQGTETIYDRKAGGTDARVLSLRPDGGAFGDGEDATYVAATEDGSGVVFKVGGTLYLHRAGVTIEVATAPNTFAGIAEDGGRVFYTDGPSDTPATLFACEVDDGPCAGPGALPPIVIAPESIFVTVSADGSSVYFTSEQAFTGAEENEAAEMAKNGTPNLYSWGAGTRFVAALAAEDLEEFGGDVTTNLRRWATAVQAGVGLGVGVGKSPTRTTPDGKVFIFQSHARLTGYDNEGFSEIYRHDPDAAAGERLLCVSCDPSGTPPSADATLQTTKGSGSATVLIANLTDDGEEVFFQSEDQLLPEDANDAQDVYQWKAKGEGCKRDGGCLDLISSGQGETDNIIYAVAADGHDVFFRTLEVLVDVDVPGSVSIYDARIGGGIPIPSTPAPCQGDACQGQGSVPPVLPTPAGAVSGGSNARAGKPRPRCAKGKRKVRRNGKTRCVKRPGKRRGRSADVRRASTGGRTSR